MEVKKVQRIGRSHYVVLPKGMLEALSIVRGTFVMVYVENGRIIVEKLGGSREEVLRSVGGRVEGTEG